MNPLESFLPLVSEPSAPGSLFASTAKDARSRLERSAAREFSVI